MGLRVVLWMVTVAACAADETSPGLTTDQEGICMVDEDCPPDEVCEEGRCAGAELDTDGDGGAGTPELGVDAKELDFGSPLLGIETCLSFTVENTGDGALVMGEVELVEDDENREFRLATAGLDGYSVDAGDHVAVTVCFSATDDQDDSGQVFIRSNDPDRPEAAVALMSDIKGDPYLAWCVLAPGMGVIEGTPSRDSAPCALDESIDFGTVGYGESAMRELALWNDGTDNRPLDLQGVAVTDTAGLGLFVVEIYRDSGSDEEPIDFSTPVLMTALIDIVYVRVTLDGSHMGAVPEEALEAGWPDADDVAQLTSIPFVGEVACPSGYVDLNDDPSDGCECEGTGFEQCNGIDDDCDGMVDEGFALCEACCDSSADSDLCLDDSVACVSLDAADCVDSGGSILEECDGADNNCDDVIDEGFDVDGDLFTSCGGDCDDDVATTYPGAAETCNGADDDCDGMVDEGFALCEACCDSLADSDFCSDDSVVCISLDAADCVDSGGSIVEACDGADNNCDGTVDEGFDEDGDLFSVCAGDCDDDDPATYPAAAESCNDIDDDCDGAVDEDFDLDNDGVATCAGDCDDAVATTYLGAVELCNGVDDDCDGEIDEGENSCGGICPLAFDSGSECDSEDDIDVCPDDRYECVDWNQTTCVNTVITGTEWVHGVVGTFTLGGLAVAPSGTTYVVGGFQDEVCWDAETCVTSVGESDIVLAAYGGDGSLLWAASEGTAQADEAKDVAVVTDGGVVVVGSMGGQGFVGEFDASDGTMHWLTQASSTDGGASAVNGVAVLPSGNVVVAGWFDHTIQVGSISLTAATPTDSNAFVAEIALADGTVEWAQRILIARPCTLCTGGSGDARDIGVDADGNLDVGGVFSGTVAIAPYSSTPIYKTSAGGRDTYVAKFDSTGSFLWAEAYGGTTNDDFEELGVTPTGDVRVVGTVEVLSAGNNTDIFLAGYSSAGTSQWSKTVGGADPNSAAYGERGRGIVVFEDGGFAITGTYTDDTLFDATTVPGGCCDSTNNSAFVAQYNTSGDLALVDYYWAQAFVYAQEGYGIAVGCDESLRMVGLGWDPAVAPDESTLPNGQLWVARHDLGATPAVCTNVEDLPGDAVGSVPRTTLGAGPGPGCDIGAASSPEQIFHWVAPANGSVAFSTCGGADWDTVLSASVDTCAGSQLDCDDDSCGTQSTVQFDVEADSDYYIYVGGKAGASGDFVLDWYMVDGGATVLSGTAGNVTGSTVGQPTSSGVSCWSDSSPTRYYAWRAPSNGNVTFSTCDVSEFTGTDATWNTVVYVSQDSYAGTEVACGEDRCGPTLDRGAATFTVVAGTVYYVRVRGQSVASTGSFKLEWFMGCGGSNTVAISGASDSVTGDLSNNAPGPGCWGGDDPAPMAHFLWTAPASGSVTFSTCGNPTTFEHVLSYHVGNCDNLADFLLCSDQSCRQADGQDGPGSSITFDAVAGTQYYIHLAARQATGTGTFTLQWFMGCGDVTTTTIPDAIAEAGSIEGTTIDTPGGPGCNAVGSGNYQPSERHYRWTAPRDGHVTFSTCGYGTNWDHLLSYHANDCEGEPLACTDQMCKSRSGYSGNASSVDFEAVSGTTYYIHVGGTEEAAGPFTLQWFMSCGTPIDVSTLSSYANDTTDFPSGPGCYGDGDDFTSVHHYQWTAPRSCTATFKACGGTSKAVSHHTATCDGAWTTCQAGSAACSPGISFSATEGTTYFVHAGDKHRKDSSSYTLSWTCP